MSNTNQQRGVLLALTCLLLLGFMPVITKSKPIEMSALNFALYLSVWQLFCSLPLFGKELASSNKGIFDAQLGASLRRKTMLIIVATGCIFGLSTFIYVLAIEKAGAVSTAIAIQAYPLFAILWKSLFLGRRKNRWELMFTGILIAAMYYLVTSGTGRIEGLSWWFVLALGIPFLWSVAHVIIREVLVKTPITPAQVTFFRVLVSTLLLLTLVLASGDSATLWQEITSPGLQQVALVMGVVYYLELISWFYAVKQVDVSLASSITTPAPALTMLLAFWFLDEVVVLYQILAMVVVMVSVYGLIYAVHLKSKRLMKTAEEAV
jgi:drug/metabolite transporter (DMT)-like permease